MAVFLISSGNAPEILYGIPLTITGTGDTSYCYATIGGTKYVNPLPYTEVSAGDQIVLGVYGTSSQWDGTIRINGVTVLDVTSGSTRTYTWTVPSGISKIDMSLSYASASSVRRGNITITTS